MSTLFTTTSASRPSDASTGDMYFETDTGRIIVYGGSGWSQYSPAGTGESVDDSGEINITYGTFEEILAVPDKQPGDLFLRKNVDYEVVFIFKFVPGTNTHTGSNPNNGSVFTVNTIDADDVYTQNTTVSRLTANASGQPYYWDMDQANFGTPNWQGSQNWINTINSLSHLPAGSTATVSGTNNEIVTFASPVWIHVSTNHSFAQYSPGPNYYNTTDSLLVYTGLDENDNELFSMITNY